MPEEIAPVFSTQGAEIKSARRKLQMIFVLKFWAILVPGKESYFVHTGGPEKQLWTFIRKCLPRNVKRKRSKEATGGNSKTVCLLSQLPCST